MNLFLKIVICLFLFIQVTEGRVMSKPRVIVTTDGEGDDRCSMNRFLLYAYQWQIEGLIYSSSKHHWKGRGEIEGFKWHNETWIEDQVNAYAKVYDNLIQHAPDYPKPDDLRQQIFVGNIDLEGDMDAPTPGSDHIVRVLLDDDPEPVWMQAWGGANTIARALKTIEENHPDQMAYVSQKAKIFLISEQDDTFKNYIAKQWPDVETLQSSKTFIAIAYRWNEIMSSEVQAYFSPTWLRENILENHGPLCAMYEPRSDGTFRSEGDSPAFLHMIDVGLRTLEHPTFGGWGGRFERRSDRWRSAPDDDDIYKPILRWAIAFQNDWAVKADWCVKSVDEVNCAPVVVMDHALDLMAKAGERVRLDASKTEDVDALSFKWWQYKEPGTYVGDVEIEHAESSRAVLTMPMGGKVGQTVHVICEVTDNGMPALTRYQRVIVTFSEE
jgi:hypothetical protein